jgi:hypothetical protein
MKLVEPEVLKSGQKAKLMLVAWREGLAYPELQRRMPRDFIVSAIRQSHSFAITS